MDYFEESGPTHSDWGLISEACAYTILVDFDTPLGQKLKNYKGRLPQGRLVEDPNTFIYRTLDDSLNTFHDWDCFFEWLLERG